MTRPVKLIFSRTQSFSYSSDRCLRKSNVEVILRMQIYLCAWKICKHIFSCGPVFSHMLCKLIQFHLNYFFGMNIATGLCKPPCCPLTFFRPILSLLSVTMEFMHTAFLKLKCHLSSLNTWTLCILVFILHIRWSWNSPTVLYMTLIRNDIRELDKSRRQL